MKSRMKDTLLLVGSDTSDRANLHAIFEPTYYLLEAENAAQGTMLLKQNSQCIAAVLADIPLIEEEDIRELVAASSPNTESEIPVIILVTPNGTGQREEMAFLMGAADVVRKPYTSLSIQRRVQVLVDLYLHRWHLEKLVETQSSSIRNTYQTMVDAMSAIIERRSTESGNHVLRLRGLTKILLKEVARCCPEYELSEALIDTISAAAALHDIGKIAIPDAILNKPGPLSKEEFEIMKTHTTVGAELVAQLEGLGNILDLRYAYNISLSHHERWDGKGYPNGLKGNEIPICAQVVGITDAFDALTTPRVYKPAYPYQAAINMILNGECGAFSPKLLECFKHVRKDLIRLAQQYVDGNALELNDIHVPLSGPVTKDYALDAMQLSQLKYQTLLHHLNDTIMEVDVDNQVYHMVYNPNPDFLSLISSTTLDDVSARLMLEGVHPEDAESMQQMRAQFSQKLFQQNQRKCAFRCRIFNPPHNAYHNYEITLLRVNTDDPERRIVIAVFHNLENHTDTLPVKPKQRMDMPVLYDLMNASLCCCNDDALTMVDGIHTLMQLTGYSIDQIWERFGNSLLKLVIPEDRQILIRMEQDAIYNGGKQEAQFRIHSRNGEPLWVIGRSRTHTDRDGTEYRFYTLSDITCVKKEQKALEDTISRNQVIIDQSEGVIFEWDVGKDRFACSEKWEKRFGYTINSENFSRQIANVSRIHPDDLSALRKKLQRLLTETCTEFVDARIANNEGRYLWSRIRASSLTDSQGRIAYIIGVIHDINELKSDVQILKQQAERDALTKLLNRASTQQAVEEYLENRPSGTLAAMLVLDMDDFKAVNDNYGHLYGDAVLTQIGTNLRNLFRSHDVIGRIGGDEFLVLMKDTSNTEIVRDRCELLVKTFRDQMQQLMPNLSVSISVGCALIPAHGSSYQELFRHADNALLAAKRTGKCRYKIYNPQDQYDSLENAILCTTRIDSDEQSVSNDEGLIRFVFHSLYESRNIEATIDELMAFIGTRFNVSRVYIFENDDDNTHCSNTFEWCNEGIRPEKDFLQNLSYETDIPNWAEAYDDTGIIYCTDIKDLPLEIQNVVEPQGIKSMLHCAIRDQGVFRGFVGFDECTTGCFWTQGQISLLQFFAEVLAVFLIKQRGKDQVPPKAK